MTAEEITRAKLYARSAAFAENAGNPKLRDVFTRRGIAIAGDHWPHLYADRDNDGVSGQDAPEAPTPEEKPTKAKRKAKTTEAE